MSTGDTASNRECGDCTVCCTVGAVPELNKPAYEECRFLCSGCSLFSKPERPKVCGTFKCSWLWGHGKESDRPDQIGVMFAINGLEGRHYHTAIELEVGALMDQASDMAVNLLRTVPLPMIVCSHGADPDSAGDSIGLPDNLVNSWRRNVGALVTKIAPEIGIYELRRDA